MGNIISIFKYTKGKDKMTHSSDTNITNKIQREVKLLIEEIRNKNQNKIQHSLTDIDFYAKRVRYIIMGDNNSDPTPVVKVAEFFGFLVFQSNNINKAHSGNIHINIEKFNDLGNKHIIIVDKKENLLQQRFVIAHELGHYLFDFLGSKYDINNQAYSCPYLKDNHLGEKEQVANRFAASLLMPKEMFLKEYEDALNIDKRGIYVNEYLSCLFKVKEESIVKRFKEVGVLKEDEGIFTQ